MNKEYIEFVLKRRELMNKLKKTPYEESECILIGDKLTRMERQMTSKEIILSIREAHKKIKL